MTTVRAESPIERGGLRQFGGEPRRRRARRESRSRTRANGRLRAPAADADGGASRDSMNVTISRFTCSGASSGSMWPAPSTIRSRELRINALRRSANAGVVSRSRLPARTSVGTSTAAACSVRSHLLRHREEQEPAQGPGEIRDETLANAVDQRKLHAARDQHESSYEIGSPRGERDRDRAAQRVTDDDDRAAGERAQDLGGDGGVLLDARGARRRIGLPMPRQVERDHAQRVLQALELSHPGVSAHTRAVDQQRRSRATALGDQVRDAASAS